jgi:hypothetical protein
MRFRCLGQVVAESLAIVACLSIAATAVAAPRIGNVSLRGLQSGGTTSLVIDGSELAPEARIMLGIPGAQATIKPSSTATRLEVDVAVDGQTAPGIYLLRVASASGVSDAVALGVDSLPQSALVPTLPSLNVAMTGALSGSSVVSTSFAGKRDERVVVEVESRRLGSALNPVVHIYDSRRVQKSWGQALPSIGGDTRCELALPADGVYTIELHDALFRGGDPGFFRLKVGKFHYADLIYPLGVAQGATTTFEYAASNLPAEARGTGMWPNVDGPPTATQAAPWPAGIAGISGSRPRVLVSKHAEVVEAPPADKPQDVPPAPVAINGRLAAAREQDRYRLAVKPGERLLFDVLARRAGSPMDGVLSIQNEQGGELAANDDRPGTSDPGLEFTVPADTSAVIMAIRDLEGRGGADSIYRISVSPAGQPDFTLSLADDRYQIPKDGVALARVKVERAGYNGAIKLQFSNLPTSVSVTGDEIPAGASEALVTLSAPGLTFAQSLATVLGTSTEGNVNVKRAALPKADDVTRLQPWLRDEVAVAVTMPSALALAWDLFSGDAKLVQGTALPITLRVQRAAGANGAVRLSLLTTQVTPRKKIKVNNQDREVDDVERTLRFEAAPTIAADQNEATAKILVPADLPRIAFDLAIQAELLAADNKTVVASAVTAARRITTVPPITVELASQGTIEARAGMGPTGKLSGKVVRASGFALPVSLTLAGLPAGVNAPLIVVPGEQTEFEFPIALPYATPAGDLPNCKLVASATVDAKVFGVAAVRADEVPLALKVVPGEKPAVEQPLAIFEDQSEFVTQLNQGGGQATLVSDEKYSGTSSVKVTPDQKFNPALPGLGVKIREKPGPGEFRYLQFAWKKQGGAAICLQLNHDGQWGPAGDKPAKFRYHAGGGAECFGASVSVDGALPAEFSLVTRDLFADFGEFTLTGIALSPMDGQHALFDHIYLGTSPEDFELVKP